MSGFILQFSFRIRVYTSTILFFLRSELHNQRRLPSHIPLLRKLILFPLQSKDVLSFPHLILLSNFQSLKISAESLRKLQSNYLLHPWCRSHFLHIQPLYNRTGLYKGPRNHLLQSFQVQSLLQHSCPIDLFTKMLLLLFNHSLCFLLSYLLYVF